MASGNDPSGATTSFAAHASADKLIIEIPLVFHNTGAKPIVIDNLRLRFLEADADGVPLKFIAVVDKIGTDEGRTFASQFPVQGRAAIKLVCEFQRRPGNFEFKARTYPMALEAKLDDSDEWHSICEFPLLVKEWALETIHKIFRTYYNAP